MLGLAEERENIVRKERATQQQCSKLVKELEVARKIAERAQEDRTLAEKGAQEAKRAGQQHCSQLMDEITAANRIAEREQEEKAQLERKVVLVEQARAQLQEVALVLEQTSSSVCRA